MSKKKVLYFDTETTGLDHRENEIVQFSAIMEIDGKPVDEIDIRIQPTRWDKINQEALDITGVTVEQMKGYMTPPDGLKRITAFLDRHINKYDKADKAFPAGHNVAFDIDFLSAFFKQHGGPYGLGPYLNWQSLDSRILANFYIYTGTLDLENVKLETLCKHFKIDLDAHDSLNDIRATRQLMQILKSGIGLREDNYDGQETLL